MSPYLESYGRLGYNKGCMECATAKGSGNSGHSYFRSMWRTLEKSIQSKSISLFKLFVYWKKTAWSIWTSQNVPGKLLPPGTQGWTRCALKFCGIWVYWEIESVLLRILSLPELGPLVGSCTYWQESWELYELVNRNMRVRTPWLQYYLLMFLLSCLQKTSCPNTYLIRTMFILRIFGCLCQQVLVGFLRNAAIGQPTGKRQMMLPVLASKLLIRAFATEPDWPLELVQVSMSCAIEPGSMIC